MARCATTIAPAVSREAASSIARQRAPTASVQDRSIRTPLVSKESTSGSASAARPVATSASTASGR